MIAPNASQTSTGTRPLLRICVALSGLSGALGVVCLALSAHATASGLLTTIAQMLLAHAPVFLGIGLLSQVRRAPFLPVAATVLSLGLVLFCGDLAARIVFDHRLFPMSAPIGGGLVILSWIVLAISALRLQPR
ncbi:DUF423 domain-containing protein [Roseibium sp.]|uniref:DUF423 domain-containing protein n=1 Tax=Roseibium sp. TaxID=1936156 RepID=UPI003D139917